MGSWTEQLPAAPNAGHTYRDRVALADLQAAAALGGDARPTVSAFYAGRYPHSPRGVWLQRLAAGQIRRNGRTLWADERLLPGDRLAWQRPPWEEPAVPRLPHPGAGSPDAPHRHPSPRSTSAGPTSMRRGELRSPR